MQYQTNRRTKRPTAERLGYVEGVKCPDGTHGPEWFKLKFPDGPVEVTIACHKCRLASRPMETFDEAVADWNEMVRQINAEESKT